MISSISLSLNENVIKNNKLSFKGSQQKTVANVPLTVTDKFLRDVEFIAKPEMRTSKKYKEEQNVRELQNL